MIHAQSEKVQCEAANSILNALKRPETSKIEMDVNIKDNSGISELKNVMMQVASHQAKQIQAGENHKRQLLMLICLMQKVTKFNV